jgi:hypothetical protein
MFWEVKISRAKRPVVLLGPLKQGRPGTSIGCGISELARNQPDAFPHKAYLVSVIKTSMFVVDKLDHRGLPAHAVWYKNRYGWVVLANDTKELATFCRENPEALKGPFTFTPPPVRTKGGGGKNKPRGPREPVSPHIIPRGCLRRARDANLIDPVAMKQLTKALA